MFASFEDADETIIKLIGVGSSGCDAIENMIHENIEGIQFIALNTDSRVLASSNAEIMRHIAGDMARGDDAISMGACDSLRDVLDGADIVFIVAGMGSDAGTGITSNLADVAREMGSLTVAMVIEPAAHEGEESMSGTQEMIAAISRQVDTLITVPDGKQQDHNLLSPGDGNGAHEMLLRAVKGMTGLITRPGFINVDVDDIRAVMGEMGLARVGTGISTGENRAEEAIRKAISRLHLREEDLLGARGVLVNITAGLDMTIEEFEVVGNIIKTSVAGHATVVLGTVIDPLMMDEMQVTVLATGIRAECNTTTVPDVCVQPQSGSEPDCVDFPAFPLPHPSVFGNGDQDLVPLFDKAVAFVVGSRRCTPASVQRELKISYNRAAYLIELMETQGIVSARDDNGQRDVLVPQPVCE